MAIATTDTPRTAASDLASRLAAWRTATEVLLACPVADVPATEASRLHRELRSGCDRLLAYAAQLLTRVESDGSWKASGLRSFPEWVSRRSGSSVGSARREASLGKALESDLPLTRAAVGSGEISLEHAQVLSRFAPTSDARKQALTSGGPGRDEASLVAKAKWMGVDEFGRAVRRWAGTVDATAAEADHRAACARERLNLIQRDGGVSVDGFLTAEHGEAVAGALRAIIAVPAKDDERTPEQRRAAALTDLARMALDHGLVGSGQVRPHLSVHVQWESFLELVRQSGAAVSPAELENGEPIPASVLSRLACDSAITRIVFGPQGQPLDVGRAQRVFTPAQRRAIVGRDRSCAYPECTVGPDRGEIHHAEWWARDDGPTSVENGVLLCWYHHDLVHQQNLAIAWGDGGWRFLRPDGSPITPVGRRPGAPEIGPPDVGRGVGPPDVGPGAGPPGVGPESGRPSSAWLW